MIVSINLSFLFAQEIEERDSFIAAKKAYDGASYAVSIDLLKRFINNFPKSKALPEAKLYLGQCLFNVDKFIEARDVLTELENSSIPYGIEDRLLFWMGQVYLKVDDFSKAADYFNKIMKIHPDSNLVFSAKLQLGWILVQGNKLEEAKTLFDSLSEAQDATIKEEAQFNKGELQFQTKDYSGALSTFKVFSGVFTGSPRLAEAYFYMAESSYYMNNLEEAVDYYSAALEKSNDSAIKAMSLQGIGWSYLNLNKLKEAESAFLRIGEFIDNDFNKGSLFFGKATLCSRLKQFDKAVSYYDELINTYPESEMFLQSLLGRAECLNDLARFDEAVTAYKKFVDICSKEKNEQAADLLEKARYNLGFIYLRVNDFNSAISEFKEIASLSNNKELRLSALYQIAQSYYDIKDFDKAIELYYQILQEYPDNTYNDYVLYQLGLLQLESNQINAAMQSFKRFNKDFTSSEFLDDINYYLGYAYFLNSELDIACEQLQKFTNVFSDSIYMDKATYLLGVSFYNRGMYKEAISNFENVMKGFRQNSDLVEKAEYEIANAFYQLGDREIAVRRLNQFINTHPKSDIAPSVIFWLGQYYHQDLQYDLARRNFEMLVRMYPKHDLSQSAKYEIGLIFVSEQKYTDAIQTFERLLEVCNQDGLKAKTILAIGDLLSSNGQVEEAIKYYSELVQMISSDRMVSQVIKETEEKNKLIRNTIEYREKKIIAENESLDDNVDIGDEDSHASVIKFIKLACIRLGDIYKDNKNFTEAINIYNQALNLPFKKDNAQIQFKIAELLEERDGLGSALEPYSNIAYNFEEDKIWIAKGLLRSARIYEDKGEWQKAEDTYDEIINFDIPESKYAQERLNIIKKQLKSGK